MDRLSEEVGIIVIGSMFLLLVAVGIIILVFSYQRRQARYLQEKAALKAAFERELLEAQLEMQELTMKSIAQEIHDNVGQTLGLAKLNLNTLNPQKQEAFAEKISSAKSLVSQAITDLRTLSRSLHSEAALSTGLSEAIATQLQQIEKAGLFQTAFSIEGPPATIDAQKELILFRAVQEALNNAVKHSGAQTIAVRLCYSPSELLVEVQDDGKGWQPPVNGTVDGSGLRNMRNRAKLIGASFDIESRQPGTQVRLNLPIIAG
jgi:signal transduction histidine kinase